ncbi:uncharacterized protein TOT_040000792 [Theileria orientalis strain Shintoku]|uniref:Clathrin/coatomer adaptor adaptin-like N-terminal domain-containing protein n=1 Tax=Theileria orientalis strain Shintoku TaxID=869250 RepID=J7M4R0_THEOR|nr:uncharacterized protein TOT_040000792 [Theileria orientalis strain Shintoku]BAM42425.1 uncharacterized protein TOT_040000792 [Theileria orientalis strain Shintoku]|eukprot:XP_009692726.1 uncharacterized protein TOT_040000792 [Theileria orientalis strain Shintoku]
MLNLGIPHVSREFHRFTQSISDSKSKQEEERLISREISLLKLNFQNKNVSKNQLKDYLLRCLYIEMLGFNTKFAYIHAINMAQDKHLVYKSTGYLCCMTMLESKSDLLLLLINTIQKDLQSPNFMDRLTVLNSLCYLINEEMLPIVLPLVNDCLVHENALIRKKTIVLMTRMYELFPEYLTEYARPAIEKGLCDVDPSVMNVTLNLLQLHISLNEESSGSETDKNGSKAATSPNYINHVTIANVLVNIWKQILDNKLSRDYNYHRIQGPFIQLNILKLLTLLNKDGKAIPNIAVSGYARDVYSTLYKFVQSIEKSARGISNALVYQFIQLLSTIQLDSVLTSISSQLVTRYVHTSTLGYISSYCLSVTSILIEKGVNLSFDDQVKIISLLQEDDLTIQKVIIKLLYKLINKNNYQVVVTQLVDYIRRDYIIDREEIIRRIIGYCTLYAPTTSGAEETTSSEGAEADMSIANVILEIIEILSSSTTSKSTSTMATKSSDVLLSGIIKFITRHHSQTLNFYMLNKCYQMYNNNDSSDLLIKLMIWLVKYILLIEENRNAGQSESSRGKLYGDIVSRLLSKSTKYDSLLLYWILNNYRQILILANSSTTSAGGDVEGDGIATKGTGENVLYDGLEEVFSKLGNKYVDLVKQILVEIANIQQNELPMRLNSKEYDTKLTFLKVMFRIRSTCKQDYVESSVSRGCRPYERNMVMDKYKQPVEYNIDDDVNEGKLIYKPYMLMPMSSIEMGESVPIPYVPGSIPEMEQGAPGIAPGNMPMSGMESGNVPGTIGGTSAMGADSRVGMDSSITDGRVPEGRVVVDKKTKSWGPKGYNPSVPATTSTVYTTAKSRMGPIGTSTSSGVAVGASSAIHGNTDATDKGVQGGDQPVDTHGVDRADSFNIDNVILNKLESNKWSAKSIERQKNEELAKQLFQSNG